MSINKVIFTGRLGKDVELKYTTTGKAVANFILAVNDSYDRDKTHWLPIVVWGKSAENCAQYIGKGSHIAVEGRVSTRDYEKQDGTKVYVTEFVADRVEFLDSKKSGESKPQQPKDDWSDLGRDVSLTGIDIVDDSEDQIPF